MTFQPIFKNHRLGFQYGLALLGLLAVCLALQSACSVFAASAAAPKTVAQVDLDRYTGKWYEIAAIPMYFERKCVGNTTAEYTLQTNGRVSVVNSCDLANGKRQLAVGEAKAVEPETNAKLKVTFLNLPGLGWQYWASGDYWILDLASDYSTVIVGHPTRKYGWILSRTPKLEDSQLASLEAELRKQGYDPCTLIMTPQQGGATEKQSLCEYLKRPSTETKEAPAQ